jgi:hypothetical protein
MVGAAGCCEQKATQPASQHRIGAPTTWPHHLTKRWEMLRRATELQNTEG